MLLLLLNNEVWCQCKCSSLKIVSFKNFEVNSSSHFVKLVLKTKSKSSKCRNDYADFWIVSNAGDTLNENTQSAMRIPYNHKKVVSNVITLRSNYDRVPDNFSGRLIFVSEDCSIPIKINSLKKTLEFNR